MGSVRNSSSLFWDLYSHVYDLMLLNPPYQNLLKKIAKEIKLEDEMTILDAGCGTGNLEKELLQFSNINQVEIFAIDSSPSMLNRAGQKIKSRKIHLSHHNLNEKLPFTKNYFDEITAINVLYSLNNPEFLLKEFNRLLKTGGKLIIVNPQKKVNISEFYRAILSSTTGFNKLKILAANLPLFLFNMLIALKAKKKIYHFWEKEKWIEVLTNLGYDKIKIAPIYIQGYFIIAYK